MGCLDTRSALPRTVRGPSCSSRAKADLATAPQLRECLRICAAKVVLDFSDVTFMDSSALGIVVAARKRADDNGGADYLAWRSADAVEDV